MFHFIIPPLPTVAQVRLGANGDWLAYVREGTNINLHNIHTGETVPVEPLSSIGIGHPMGHLLNWYNGTTVSLKKIAIPEAPTRSCGNKDYSLIAVFDIAIAFTKHPACGGQSWTMLSAADLLPYEYEDAVLLLNRIFAVTSQGTCFIWDTSYGILPLFRFNMFSFSVL
jgi:hypothetical protein